MCAFPLQPNQVSSPALLSPSREPRWENLPDSVSARGHRVPSPLSFTQLIQGHFFSSFVTPEPLFSVCFSFCREQEAEREPGRRFRRQAAAGATSEGSTNVHLTTSAVCFGKYQHRSVEGLNVCADWLEGRSPSSTHI